jgi:hypothetical protein
MEFEQQKPITPEYRRNWERIYLYPNGCPVLDNEEGSECHSVNANYAGQTRQPDERH